MHPVLNLSKGLKVCSTIPLHAVKLNNLSLLLFFFSLLLQYGCTALQTARGKRPQVALCVYVNMVNMHALLCFCMRATCQLHPFRFISFHTSAFPRHLLCMRCHHPLLPPICSNSAFFSLQSIHPSISVDSVGQHTSWAQCQRARTWTFGLHVAKRLRLK